MTTPKPRPVQWLKAARKSFEAFPLAAQIKARDALRVVARGQKPDIAKLLHALGSGVWELAIKERGDAYRVVYALVIGDDIWVIHAFQKKSKSGVATPKVEIDTVRERLKRLRSS